MNVFTTMLRSGASVRLIHILPDGGYVFEVHSTSTTIVVPLRSVIAAHKSGLLFRYLVSEQNPLDLATRHQSWYSRLRLCYESVKPGSYVRVFDYTQVPAIRQVRAVTTDNEDGLFETDTGAVFSILNTITGPVYET